MHSQGSATREGHLLVESGKAALALPAEAVLDVVPLQAGDGGQADGGRGGLVVFDPDGYSWPLFELDRHLCPVPSGAAGAAGHKAALLDAGGARFGLAVRKTTSVSPSEIWERISIPDFLREPGSPVRGLLRLADGTLVAAAEVRALVHYVLDAGGGRREDANG